LHASSKGKHEELTEKEEKTMLVKNLNLAAILAYKAKVSACITQVIID
jgi:hypothetical protein